jgi:hypothetical protein
LDDSRKQEEKMTNETSEATPYRAYLEELAHSRGLDSAEELAEAACKADPDFTAREILLDPGGGFGQAIDVAISLSEEEKDRLTDAWKETFIEPRE